MHGMRGASARTRPCAGRRRARKGSAGLTLIEVVVASAVVVIVVLGSSGAFMENLQGASSARKLTSATLYLDTVRENLTAQDPSALLAMNGNQFFDGADGASSEFRVDLTVFTTDVELLQLQLNLIELSSGRLLGSINALRSQR